MTAPAFILLAAALASSPAARYFPLEADGVAVRCPDGRVVADLSRGEKGYLPMFAKALEMAGEAPLYRVGAAAPASTGRPRTLRFTWMRTFHAPIVIHLSFARNGQARLVASRLAGQGGYAFGPLEKRVRLAVSPEDAAKIRDLYGPEAFPLPPAPSCGPPGLDGAQWLMEGVDEDGGYRFSPQWSPRTGRMRELGILLIRMAGWQAEQLY